MAYPAKGFESIYRNHIDDVHYFKNFIYFIPYFNIFFIYLIQVKCFLNQKHPDSYIIINLSGRDYDEDSFDENKVDFK